jgi:predicted small secreted protein
MKMKKSIPTFLLICAATLLLAACANNKKPADQAITAADSALDAAGEDAKRFVPEQYNEVLKKLNALKTSFNKSNYDEVIAGAPAVLTAITGLAAAAATKKEEGMQVYAVEWTTLSVSVPATIAAVEKRGEALEKSKKVPEGVDLLTARRYVAEANNGWKQAQAAGSSGRMEAAVLSAKKAQQRAQAAAKYLQMTLPPG